MWRRNHLWMKAMNESIKWKQLPDHPIYDNYYFLPWEELTPIQQAYIHCEEEFSKNVGFLSIKNQLVHICKKQWRRKKKWNRTPQTCLSTKTLMHGLIDGMAPLGMQVIAPQQQPQDDKMFFRHRIDQSMLNQTTKNFPFFWWLAGSGMDAPLMALRKLFKDKAHLVKYMHLDWIYFTKMFSGAGMCFSILTELSFHHLLR